MASGNSEDPAQIPVKCHVCELSDIKVKCLHCDLYLCQLCSSRIHSKSKGNKDHFIIDLKDFGSQDSADLQRRFDLENVICSTHQGQKCITYCTECVKTICLQCIRDTCHSHNHEDLNESYESKYSKAKETQDEIENNISYYDNEEIRLEKSLSESRQQSDQLRKQIHDQENEIKEAAAKFSQKLLQTVDDIYMPGQTKFQDELKRIKKIKDDLKEHKQNIDEVLLSYQATDILNQVGLKETKIPEKVTFNIQISQAMFIKSDVTGIPLNELFGGVYRIPELSLSKSYKTNLTHVCSIVHADQDTKFIGSFENQKLQKVEAKNNNIEVIKEEDITVYDMGLMDNGDIVISSGGSELTLYTKTGTVETYKTFSGLQTLGVHVNKNHEVLVGLTEPTSTWSVSQDSVRMVVVLHKSRSIQHTYKYDKNNQRIFTGPFRIVTCRDNICVVDLLNESKEGRVVVIDYRGQIQWVYNGCGSGTDRPKFYPLDIAVTSTDMVLVSDSKNHGIHVLTSTGEVTVCHNVRSLGIEFPLSLSIDPSNGLLWVGCGRQKDKSPAKLHVVEFLE